MEIHGHDVPKWIAAIIGGLVFIAGVFRAIFVVQASVKSHGRRLDEHDKKLKIWTTSYLEKVAQTDLHDLMTEKAHTGACKEIHVFITEKIEEVRHCVDNGHNKLALRMDKMDKIREDAKSEAIKRDYQIAKTLGRVEEHLERER